MSNIEINALAISETDAAIIASCLMATHLKWDEFIQYMKDEGTEMSTVETALMRVQLYRLIHRFNKAFDNVSADVVDSEKS